MKINRNKGNLQSQLAKMLQAGMENVESETSAENKAVSAEKLRANEQTHNTAPNSEPSIDEEAKGGNNTDENVAVEKASTGTATRQAARPVARQTAKQTPKTSTKSRRQVRQPEPEAPRLNAAQRHEVPDHNTKYAGEPIKSVGCRMPQSLYARMLQYKALNDSQLNRITLNDIIIEAVEKFMDENQ